MQALGKTSFFNSAAKILTQPLGATTDQSVLTPQSVSEIDSIRASNLVAKQPTTRRGFLGSMFGALGVAAVAATPVKALAETISSQPLVDYAGYEQLLGFKVAQVSGILHDHESGERVRLIYGENGEFRVDYRLSPGGYIPFEHYHSEQAEIFKIIKGHFELSINGVKHEGRAGETLVVPAGANHIGHNLADEEVQIIVTFDPLLDADELFARYWQICDEGHTDKFGRPNLLLLLKATADLKSKTYPAHAPRGLVDAARSVENLFLNHKK